MKEKDFIIITCSKCKVKNRIKVYESNKIPICGKCKIPLVNFEENDTFSKYGKSLNNFMDLPDIELR